MKKTAALCLLLLFSSAAWSAPDGMSSADLKKAVSQKVRESSCSLASFYQKKLETYYERTDFSDAQKKSGWYRVQDFLNWLRREEPRLKQEKIDVLLEEVSVCDTFLGARAEDPLSRKRLAVYIGARYALSRLGYAQLPPEIVFSIHPNHSSADFDQTAILISAERVFSLPEFINLGAHEITHLLPLAAKDGSARPLGELATYYVQSHFGLPLKPSQAVCFSNGARCLPHTLSAAEGQNHVLYEYNSFLAGAVLGDKVNKAGLLRYRIERGWERPVAEVALHLLFIQQQKLSFTGKQGTYLPKACEYVAALFPQGVDSKPVCAFYLKWLSKLDGAADWVASQPVLNFAAPGQDQTSEDEPQLYFKRQKMLENFLSAHESLLYDSLIKTFAETRVKQPAVPDGYI